MTTRVFIATPCFGGLVTQTYVQSVIGCMVAAQDQGVELTLSLVGNDALITRCRNTLVQQFMQQPDATHLLFIDSDIGFPHDAIGRLVAAGKDVIGGLYPLKDRYWNEMTAERIARGEPADTASLRYVGECEKLHETPAGSPLVQVAYAGTGFLLISRNAIERLILAHPESAYTRIDAARDGNGAQDRSAGTAWALFECMIDPATGTYLSEDFAFCQRWRDIGGDIWLDPSLILTHVGPSSFTGAPQRRVGIMETTP
ncbi:hypothetical protein LOC54_07765 [Acetobacter sp. AN02]|uniref:hypothetical protein n=1 Tax=Acetobacter sp. AN02 TaxID=2894186 RepID=UPI0024343B87|nr:hypothetical protein [Acetobacter sp. AN02]MDG6095004.1 hypothetical protein [Acetobacter sp. AN02]